MLAHALLTFTLEYERVAELSLAILADLSRLADEEGGGRIRDLPHTSGVSEEALAMAIDFWSDGKWRSSRRIAACGF